MRILVTGASGLLGLSLALEACPEHTVFGQAHSQRLNTSQFEIYQADLLVPGVIERLIDRTQPDWVIHCAAMANLDACEADPERAKQLNSEVPAKLASVVARGGARLLHVSTDAVFDGQHGDYSEDDTPHPLSTYAHTKLEGERAVKEANPAALIARVNLYGWSLSGRRSLGEFFFNNLSAGRQVMGFTDVYFCPLLANDLAHIFLKMLSARLTGLYHVVSSECTSKLTFGQLIARTFGFDERLVIPTSVNQAGLKATRSPHLTLRSDKIAQALGESLPGIASGLERFYVLYLQGYPNYIRQIGTQAIGHSGNQAIG